MIVYAHTTLIHNTSIPSLIRTLLIIIYISYLTPISTCIYMCFYCSMPVQKLLILTLNSHGEPQWISLYLSLSLSVVQYQMWFCFTCKCKSWKFKEESWGGRERERQREREREREKFNFVLLSQGMNKKANPAPIANVCSMFHSYSATSTIPERNHAHVLPVCVILMLLY